jgi:hypothetical protein
MNGGVIEPAYLARVAGAIDGGEHKALDQPGLAFTTAASPGVFSKLTIVRPGQAFSGLKHATAD